MRALSLSVVGAAGLVLGGLGLIPAVPALGDPVVERVVVTFPQPVRVQHGLLVGTYVIEHDEARMARGEPCTHIYEGTTAQPGSLVTAFHCVHLNRPLATNTTLVFGSSRDMQSVRELREFQFAGSMAGHGVPR